METENPNTAAARFKICICPSDRKQKLKLQEASLIDGRDKNRETEKNKQK